MKTKIFFVFLGILALIGTGFILYPSLADYINSKNNETVIMTYSESTQTLSDEDIKNELAKAQNFNKLLVKGALSGDEENEYKTAMEEYSDILNFDDVICTVEIPKINVDLPVYHGSNNNDEKLKKGCVHLQSTSFPVGGTSTHAVISAHSGYPEQKFFDDLEDLGIGDKFTINILNQTLTYKVCDINVVEPDDSSLLEIENGRDYVTLVTCYPYSINTHRLCVRGERVENESTATTDETADSSSKYYSLLGIRLTLLILVFIIAGLVLGLSIKKSILSKS